MLKKAFPTWSRSNSSHPLSFGSLKRADPQSHRGAPTFSITRKDSSFESNTRLKVTNFKVGFAQSHISHKDIFYQAMMGTTRN